MEQIDLTKFKKYIEDHPTSGDEKLIALNKQNERDLASKKRSVEKSLEMMKAMKKADKMIEKVEKVIKKNE